METGNKVNKNIFSSHKNRLIALISIFVIASIGIIIYLAFTGNVNQVYTDVVVGYLSKDGNNKSAEKYMLYLFAIIGSIIYAITFVKNKWGQNIDSNIKFKDYTFAGVALLVAFITNVLFLEKVNYIMAAGLILILGLWFINKSHIVSGISFFFITIYSFCGIYRIMVMLGINASADEKVLAVISFLITCIVEFFSKKNSVYGKSTLIAQLLIPFALLVYLTSNYKYNDETISLHVPFRIQFFIWAIILLFVLEVIVQIKRNWASDGNTRSIITYGTLATIMAFNSFYGTGNIISEDIRHPYENVIGYFQMVEMGQKAFSEYIPVSGMYSLLHGAFLALFGKGLFGYYNITTNIFYLVIILVIAFLLKQQLDGMWMLLIALTFRVINYDRVILIMPIILLLIWPKLIQKKNLWLKAWFLSSFIHGLYYPVFGATVCVGFLPLGIWQIYTYAKSGNLKKDVASIKFWIGWGICCIPVALGMNWLVGTAKHMASMGSQTVYADGITRFGEEIIPEFLSYVTNKPLRLILYYIFSYIILISIVWISVALFLRISNFSIGAKFSMDNPVYSCIALGIGLAFLLAFSHTSVSLEGYNVVLGKFDIYYKNTGLIAAVSVLLIVIIARHLKESSRNCLWLLAYAIFIVSIISGEGLSAISDNSKLEVAYSVPDGYIYINENEPRVGECFFSEDLYEYISNGYNAFQNMDKEQSYLGLFDQFGFYYLCSVKGGGNIELYETINGYTETKETVENLLSNGTIVGTQINPVENYYLYHWLLTSGYYKFDSDQRLFLPNDGEFTKEEIQEQNKYITVGFSEFDLGNTPGSFGSSMESLENIFVEKQLEYSIIDSDNACIVSFENQIDGDEADYLYIDFVDMNNECDYALIDFGHTPILQDVDVYGLAKALLKKVYNYGMQVTICWNDDLGEGHSITCNMDEGQLLIPLGSGRQWLLNSHNQISINVSLNGESVEVPTISNIRFLKLREIQ